FAQYSYPITTFYRVELNAGFFTKDYDFEIPGLIANNEKFSFIEPAVVGDTTRFKPLTGYAEAYSGQRFRISVRIPITFSSEYEDYTNTYFDYRAYVPIGKRSLFAFREWGILSSGDPPELYGVGGYNTIRGYDYNTIVGNYVALTNLELRFPLVDRIQFPGGVGFYGFRGKLFADAGAVWSKGESFRDTFDDPDTSEVEGDLYGSVGMGINFWFIGVEWHFEWARKTDFKSIGNDWVYQWSIRRSF
ncbi:BamA/TamA family outer membrane protein, partial [bacterium]|nr:BamA/TamA family outer membrane protein [candidate division CSSED10-310 bacterium]